MCDELIGVVGIHFAVKSAASFDPRLSLLAPSIALRLTPLIMIRSIRLGATVLARSAPTSTAVRACAAAASSLAAPVVGSAAASSRASLLSSASRHLHTRADVASDASHDVSALRPALTTFSAEEDALRAMVRRAAAAALRARPSDASSMCARRTLALDYHTIDGLHDGRSLVMARAHPLTLSLSTLPHGARALSRASSAGAQLRERLHRAEDGEDGCRRRAR
jgi:hypothetical protein